MCVVVCSVQCVVDCRDLRSLTFFTFWRRLIVPPCFAPIDIQLDASITIIVIISIIIIIILIIIIIIIIIIITGTRCTMRSKAGAPTMAATF